MSLLITVKGEGLFRDERDLNTERDISRNIIPERCRRPEHGPELTRVVDFPKIRGGEGDGSTRHGVHYS